MSKNLMINLAVITPELTDVKREEIITLITTHNRETVKEAIIAAPVVKMRNDNDMAVAMINSVIRIIDEVLPGDKDEND